ncbi:MAG TPA: cutinase family protein [Mycobacterium sp.]|nr:cutinase family protein [Mycobacterium sp.]
MRTVNTTANHSSRYRAARILTAAVVAAAPLLSVPLTAPSASADPCPDVEVIFARGTGEPPGVGSIGQAFVDALNAQAGGRSVDVYPVDYPAASDFDAGIEFARTFVDGIKDAANHLQTTAAHCPNTRVVLGGYSQGAALAGFVTSAAIPKEVPAQYRPYLPKPLPASVANHVAAVTLFGLPSNQFLTEHGAPPITIGPRYVNKTIQLCAPDDTICNGAPDGQPTIAHILYGSNGSTDQAAAFVVSHLPPAPAPQPAPAAAS